MYMKHTHTYINFAVRIINIYIIIFIITYFHLLLQNVLMNFIFCKYSEIYHVLE